MEAGMLAGGPRLHARGRRRYHGVLADGHGAGVLLRTEGRTDRAYALQLDLVLEAVHVRGERLDLLLEVADMR